MVRKIFIIVSVLVVMSSTVVGLSLAAAAKKPRDPIDQEDLSDSKHYDHGTHDTKYDHEAFLGEEDAATYDSLTPEQTKEKLK